MHKPIIIILGLLTMSLAATAQITNVHALIDSAYQLLQRVESYTAEATVHVDVEFINMPDKTALVHFQSPDTYDIESDGFLMIPKVGMKPMTDQLDLENYQVVDRGTEMINGKEHVVINMIPLSKKSKIVLSAIWIDPATYLISRIETFTKKAGSFLVDLEYDDLILPSQITIAFEVEGMNIPLKIFGNDAEIEKKEFRQAESNEGVVVVSFQYTEIRLIEN